MVDGLETIKIEIEQKKKKNFEDNVYAHPYIKVEKLKEIEKYITNN